MKIFVETERMILRELTLEDEQNLFELNGDPEVMKYLTGGKTSTMEEIKTSLSRIVEFQEKHRGRFGFWAAIEKKSNEFIGWFLLRPCLTDLENTRRIELGYRFKKKFWGQGLATEGSLLLLEKGFAEPEVEEVFAVTMKGNLASQAVMKKIGMTFLREFQHKDFPDSEELDVEYSWMREEWLKRHASLS